MWVCVCVYVCMYVCVDMCVYIGVCMGGYVCVYVWVCMCVCVNDKRKNNNNPVANERLPFLNSCGIATAIKGIASKGLVLLRHHGGH